MERLQGIVESDWELVATFNATSGWNVYLHKEVENGREAFFCHYPTDVLKNHSDPISFIVEDIKGLIHAYELCEIVGHEWGNIIEWGVNGTYSKECAVCRVVLEDFGPDLISGLSYSRSTTNPHTVG